MANLSQKYHRYIYPDLDIRLNRYYTGDTPDDVGTVGLWKEPLDQMYAQLPFPMFWKGLELEVWHMGCPDLINTGKVTLLDYQLDVPGYQTAVGLYTGNKKIAVGVFVDGWQPGVPCDKDPSWDNLIYTRNALSHEIGHMHADFIDYNESGNSQIAQQMTILFNNLRPNQTSNVGEDYAETFRAILGADKLRGYFSDNKPFTPSPQLNTLIRCAYWLNSNLSGKIVKNLKLNDGWCQWDQMEVVSWMWPFYRTDYMALTNNWELFKAIDGKWVKV